MSVLSIFLIISIWMNSAEWERFFPFGVQGLVLTLPQRRRLPELQHQPFNCHSLSVERTKLFDALAIVESTESNKRSNLDKHKLLSAALTHRNLVSKLGNFFEMVKY